LINRRKRLGDEIIRLAPKPGNYYEPAAMKEKKLALQKNSIKGKESGSNSRRLWGMQ